MTPTRTTPPRRARRRPRTPRDVARVAARFWRRVQRGRSGTCWEWQGAITTSGYGTLSVAGRMMPAHRRALELARGAQILPGLMVCHRCDNRRCCNPAHLVVGTASDNARDMYERGRHVQRERPPYDSLATLTAEQLAAIRIGLRLGVRTPSGKISLTPAAVARSVGVPRGPVIDVWLQMDSVAGRV